MPRDGFYFHSRWAILQRGMDFAEEGHFRNHFTVAKWHSCAKGWFRSCETTCEMGYNYKNVILRHGGFRSLFAAAK